MKLDISYKNSIYKPRFTKTNKIDSILSNNKFVKDIIHLVSTNCRLLLFEYK